MFKIIQSNSQEKLLENLFSDMKKAKKSLLEKTIVITQNIALSRWIKIEKVNADGICANLDFELPASFIWRYYLLFEQLLNQANSNSEKKLYLQDKTQLSFVIFERIQHDESLQEFPEIAQLSSPEMRCIWANEMANVYDQYLLYRPQWINDFEQGLTSECQDILQASLWQSIQNTYHFRHRVNLHQQFKTLINHDNYASIKAELLKTLPHTLPIFGLTSLAPMQLDFFMLLAQDININFYWLNPCDQFWEDFRSHKKQIELSLSEEDMADIYGHPLLTSLCPQRQKFPKLFNHANIIELQDFISPTEYSQSTKFLHVLQLDIKNANPPEKSVLKNTKLDNFFDDSVIFQQAPSKLREVEVLYEHLLNEFSNNETLHASDIVIMSPNLAAYESAIHAVFSVNDGRPKIPFYLADLNHNKPLEEAFLLLLSLPLGRISSEELYNYLCLSAVKTLALPELSLDHIKKIIQSAGVIWGENAHSYQAKNLPETTQYTWQQALEKMLASLISDELIFSDTLALSFEQNFIRQNEIEILQHFVPYLRLLFKFTSLQFKQYTLLKWVETLQKFFNTQLNSANYQLVKASNPEAMAENSSGLLLAEHEGQWQNINNAFAQLMKLSQELPEDLTFSYGVISRFLQAEMQNKSSSSSGFLSGGITFCQTLPMRAIPFKYVMILGLDNSFPRSSSPNSLNHIPHFPKIGDYSARYDDKEFLMDAILSAREQLYLSYSQDLTTKQDASNLFYELLSTLKTYYIDENVDELSLIRIAPFFVFDAESVNQKGSFRPDIIKALTSQQQFENAQNSDINHPEILSNSDQAELDDLLKIEDCIRFWSHPCRAFIKNKFGTEFSTFYRDFRSQEPFSADEKTIRNTMPLIWNINSDDKPADKNLASQKLAASQLLPDKPLFEFYAPSILELQENLDEQSQIETAHYLETDIQLPSQNNEQTITLWGQIPCNSKGEFTQVLFQKTYESHILDFYFKHLLYCAAYSELETNKPNDNLLSNLWFLEKNTKNNESGNPIKNMNIQKIQLKTISASIAKEQLIFLISQMQIGLNEALSFFIKSSYIYAETYYQTLKNNKKELSKEEIHNLSLKKAKDKWENDFMFESEYQDAYHNFLFKDKDVINEPEFAELARNVWEMYFDHLV